MVTTETRTRIREAARKRATTPEGRAHLFKICRMGKGRLKSPEHKAKISLAHFGMKPTSETRAKLSAIARARKISSATRAKMSIAHSGERNNFWKGGIHTPYGSAFNGNLRAIVRERDDYLCQNPKCYLPENGCAHDVHHIDYDKRCNDPANLITLCHRCHSKTNRGRRDHWTEYYQALQGVRDIGITMELRA